MNKPRPSRPRRTSPRPPRPASGRDPKTPPPLPLHWREGLPALLATPGYQPLDQQALSRRLRVPAADNAAFAEFLEAEEKSGRIMRVRHSLYVLPKSLGYYAGILQMNERGFGFLVPINPADADFYVAGEDTGVALHGDLVLARLKEQRGGRQRDSRLRGEVVKVLQRKRRQLVGTLRKTPLFYYVGPTKAGFPTTSAFRHRPTQASSTRKWSSN